MTYWEIIADNLSKRGWSWGCVSAIDSLGRTIFVAVARRDGNHRFIVRAGEKLTAFVELESATLRGPSDRNVKAAARFNFESNDAACESEPFVVNPGPL